MKSKKFIICILCSLIIQASSAQLRVDSLFSIIKVEDKYPKWSPDGNMIVFESNRDGGNSQIYTLKTDGTQLTRLTNNPYVNETPVWSPNGEMIMYSSYVDGDEVNNEIFIIKSDGTGVRKLTENPRRDGHATFSPDGTKILFNSEREFADDSTSVNYEIYEMNMDGSGITRLTNYDGWDTYPSYSPDGKKIVWRRIISDSASIGRFNSEIFLMNSDGTSISNLTKHKGFDGYPDWSPDGKQIVFTSNRYGSLQLFVMNADGSQLQQLTTGDKTEINSRPDWSPDGTEIVYNKTTEQSTNIQIMCIRPSSYITYFNEVPGVLSEQRTASRGVAWGDYDGDGFPDLLVANTMNNSNFLFRSLGEEGFSQVVEGEPVTSAGWTEGVSWVDYDNDGDLDIFYTTQWGNKNELFRNEGKGNFKLALAGDLTSEKSSSTSACWCDYDLDGDLDVYVVERDGVDDRLFNNQGDGKFRVVSGTKFPYQGGDGRTCAWGDVNGDNYPELYVGNFLDMTVSEPAKSTNFYYLNNQDGTFSEITNSILTADRNLTYGTSFVDYDQDNDLDLFITNISLSDVNLLFKNDGAGNFSITSTAISKIRNSPSKGHTWGDFNNDGNLDLFVANGTEGTSSETIMNFLFHGDGDGDFILLESSPIVNTPNISAGAAWGDYDRDGDLDLFVANWGNNTESNAFYENRIFGSRWLEISLKGNESNSHGIGAKVQLSLKADGIEKQLIRWMLPQTGYSSQNESIIHFGLGSASSEIEELKVYWPSGEISILNGVESNQLLIIEE